MKQVQTLAVLLSQFPALFFWKGFKVGFPPWAPADMPLPYTSQDGSRIPVVLCSEAAFCTVTHYTTPKSFPSAQKRTLMIFYGFSFHFARTSLKNMSRIEMAVASTVVFIFRHAKNASHQRTALYE
jgi:hypothetical protein